MVQAASTTGMYCSLTILEAESMKSHDLHTNSLNFHYLLKMLFPNTLVLGVRASIHKLKEGTV